MMQTGRAQGARGRWPVRAMYYLGYKVPFSSVWTAIHHPTMCSRYVCHFIPSSVQTEKEQRIMKARMKNSKLRNYTEEQSLRIQERHWDIALYHLLSSKQTSRGLVDPSLVVLLHIHTIHWLKSSYFSPCNRLTTLKYRRTTTCLKDQRARKHSFYGHMPDISQPPEPIMIRGLFW